VQNLPFHISLIHPRYVPEFSSILFTKIICRWYQDPGAAVELTPAECHTHELGPQEFKLPTKTIRSAFTSNPLDSTSHDATLLPRTQTLPVHNVFHNVQSAICPLIAGIQTQEQVTELIQSLETMQYVVRSLL
jgi:hypothetical protein